MTSSSPLNDRACSGSHCPVDGRCMLCGELEAQSYMLHKHGGMQHAHHMEWRDVALAIAGLEVAHDHRTLAGPAVHS